MKKNALLCFLFQLSMAKPVASMGKGKSVGTTSSTQGRNPEEAIFHLNGRIEPPRGAGKPQYKVHIVCESVEEMENIPEFTTDHHFSMPLHFHHDKQNKKSRSLREKKKESLKKRPSMREILSGQWKSRKCNCLMCKTDENYFIRNKHRVKKLIVMVKAQLSNGLVAERSWTIWYPDFSLHYEFHFGAVDGHSFSLKGNVVLPHWAQLEPEEELALVDMEEKVEFGRLKYGQWKLMDEKVVVVLSGGSPMVRKMYGFDIPLDAAKVRKFLAQNLVSPRVKLMYNRDLMPEMVFNAEEHAAELEKDKLAKASLKNSLQNGQKAESSGHENVAEKYELNQKAEPNSPTPAVEAKQNSVLNSMCLVCQEEFKNGERILRNKFCKHIHHKDCIMPWVVSKNKCPIGCGKLRTSFPTYLEGPVFSNDDYSFEYWIVLEHFAKPPAAEHQIEEVEANTAENAAAAAAQDDLAEPAAAIEQQNDETQSTGGSDELSLRMEEDFDFAQKKVQMDFMQQQVNYAIEQQFIPLIAGCRRRSSASSSSPHPIHTVISAEFANNRLQTLKVFDGGDDCDTKSAKGMPSAESVESIGSSSGKGKAKHGEEEGPRGSGSQNNPNP